MQIEKRNPLLNSPDERGRKVRYLQRESANYIITLIGGDIKIVPNLSQLGSVAQLDRATAFKVGVHRRDNPYVESP